MGSKAKLAKIWQQLKELGAEKEAIQRVRAPIGLPIHSQTPQEIAISVAAEIIQARNEAL